MTLAIFLCILVSIKARPIEHSNKQYIRGCYYTNWSQYRPGVGRFTPENYIPGLCTHLFYAFVIMNDDFTLKPYEWNDEDTSYGTIGMYTRLNALKQKQSNLKTLLSFGGYTFSESNAGQIIRMVSNAQNRRIFIKSVVEFVRRTNFDGFDIDWEYPDWATKASYTSLIQEMHESFVNESIISGRPKLLLTAAVAAGIDRVWAGYSGRILADHLDFLNVMTYDFHGAWESKIGFTSPLYDRMNDRRSIDSAMTYWSTVQGVPKSKLIMGFSAYGRGWTLQKSSPIIPIGSPTIGPSPAQPFTRESGIASYYEICDLIDRRKYASGFDEIQKVPYVFQDNVWIGYDDVKSFNEKLDWLMENGYGGAFVWSLDLDDFMGRCVSSSGIKYPLITAIRNKLVDTSDQIEPQPIGSSQSMFTPSPAPEEITSEPEIGPECTQPGYHPDPKSCNSFYQCDAFGTAFKLPCPDGLHFNKRVLVCDWRHAAGCDTDKRDNQ